MTGSATAENLDGGLVMEAAPGSDVVICTFGGIQQGVGMPVFEFRRILAEFNADRLFLRDVRQAWYHDGVEGLGKSLPEVEDGLARLLAPYRRKVFVGNSMGGFAALYFGSRLAADSVIAFAPQTFIGPVSRLRARDFRWRKQMARLHRRWLLRPHVFDLAALPHPKATVIVGGACREDVLHAENLRGTGAQITIMPGHDHNFVKAFRDSGDLHSILSNAVRGDIAAR